MSLIDEMCVIAKIPLMGYVLCAVEGTRILQIQYTFWIDLPYG
jgi:hypothetical protein